MFNNKYLDSAGLSVLWERIKQLVYECAGKNAVTYTLESNDNAITLVGSDGTRSSVTVASTAVCDNENQ